MTYYEEKKTVVLNGKTVIQIPKLYKKIFKKC